MNTPLGRLVAVMVASVVCTATALTRADLNATGSGTFDTNCIHTLLPGCTTTAHGDMTGTPIVSGTWDLRLDTGGPAVGGDGVCLAAAGHGVLTETGADTIEFAHVGIVCEESELSSPYHYTASFQVTGGTGRFANAIGSGDLAATFTRVGTFTRGSGSAEFAVEGTISY